MSEPERALEARRWLQYAVEDLDAARNMLQSGVGTPRQVCWFAQQAAEKAIKAILVFLQIPFRRTHDLDLLRTLIPKGDWQVVDAPPDLAELSEWSMESRYPGDWPEPTEGDARRGIMLAQDVVSLVQADLKRHGLSM